MKNKLTLFGWSAGRFAVSAVCLAMGVACAKADVDGAGDSANGKGGNGAGASGGAGFNLGAPLAQPLAAMVCK